MKNGCILCGGVGTGKSRVALAYFYTKECKGSLSINKSGTTSYLKEPKSLYIITTARKRDTLEWEGELAYFVLDGVDVVIDSWNNIEKYVGVKDAFFIFDEQRVVGKGKWAKSFIKISKNNRWILLSATPGDTWMDYIPVFVANGFYKNRTEFIRRHVVFNRFVKFPKVDHYVEEGRLNKLRNDILITMKYKRKTTRHNEVINVGYNSSDYEKVMKERWHIFEDRPIKDITELANLLRKIVNSDQSRIDAFEKLLLEHPKVIVFYNFNYELAILKEIGERLDICTAEWNGHKHEPIPNETRWLYLVQYTAGAEGWNCTTTDTIIFFSQSYSYKAMVQAAGRIDRLNTPYVDLYYYQLRSNSPIDMAISKALGKKKDFNVKGFFS